MSNKRPRYADGGVIAKNILSQLGGMGKINAMTGAYNFIDKGNGVSFRIKNAKANYIQITLNSLDLYDLVIGRIRGIDFKIVAEQNNIYADQLKGAIERATGMRLSLAEGGSLDSYRNKDLKGNPKQPFYKTKDEYVKNEVRKNEVSKRFDYDEETAISDHKAFVEMAIEEIRIVRDTNNEYWMQDDDEFMWHKLDSKGRFVDNSEQDDQPDGEGMTLYQYGVKDGEITAADVKMVIESAGLAVPDYIGGKFADGGEIGEMQHLAKILVISNKKPLSNQLSKETGDGYNGSDYEEKNFDNMSVIRHYTSGKTFVVFPKTYIEQVDNDVIEDDLNYIESNKIFGIEGFDFSSMVGYNEDVKSLSFIDVLNNPESKVIVEQIEEIGDSKDPKLVAIKKDLIQRLSDEFGYSYMAQGGSIGYKLGNMYSSNFDYQGMFAMGMKSDVSWGVKKLRKLADSFTDVNYISDAKYLYQAIKQLEEGDVENARKSLEQFHIALESIETYKKGGEINSLNSLLKRQIELDSELVDIKSKSDLTTKDGVESYKSKTVPIRERLREIDSKLEELGYEPFAKGGYLAGEWVVYNPKTYKVISIKKSGTAAKKEMNRLFNSGEYEEVGMEAKSEWDKLHSYSQEKFADGGDISKEDYESLLRKYDKIGGILEDEEDKDKRAELIKQLNDIESRIHRYERKDEYAKKNNTMDNYNEKSGRRKYGEGGEIKYGDKVYFKDPQYSKEKGYYGKIGMSNYDPYYEVNVYRGGKYLFDKSPHKNELILAKSTRPKYGEVDEKLKVNMPSGKNIEFYFVNDKIVKHKNLPASEKDAKVFYNLSEEKQQAIDKHLNPDAFAKGGKVGGRGWDGLDKGARITDIKELKKGQVYLEYTPQFNSKNLVKITRYDETGLDRPIVYGSFVRSLDSKTLEEDFSIWDFELKSNEFYYPKKSKRETVLDVSTGRKGGRKKYGENSNDDIPNNYKGKTAKEVWDKWSVKQREHFLSDHQSKIERLIGSDKKIKKGTLQSDVYTSFKEKSKSYSELTSYVKECLKEHIVEGQYARGGLLTNGKDRYEKGDEGMYEGDTVRVLKFDGTHYHIVILDEDGNITFDPKKSVFRDKFEGAFAYFPKGMEKLIEWSEENAPKLANYYIEQEVTPRQVYGDEGLAYEGEYTIEYFNEDGKQKCVITICVGDEIGDAVEAIQENYDSYIKYAEDISDGALLLDVDVDTDEDNDWVEFTFTVNDEVKLSSTEKERLDELQKKEDTDSLNKYETAEYEMLVDKYRNTKDYKHKSK